ncbi:MAG: hypothetical protein IPP83_13970 [Flavobacteriales bacterium]|nr:hypothetical protein [Flavobacteriales bacterium]
MTERAIRPENAVERINGIIKQEYLDTWCIDTVAQARAARERAVFPLQLRSPHNSISNLYT